jgi:hypothetical protein
MVSGKPSNNRPGKWTRPPPLDLYFMFTRTEVWEYVLQSRQEYDHTVTL